jgi:uncharacterized membrane protein
MRTIVMWMIAVAAALGGGVYTAVNLQAPGSPYQVANVLGLNNHGDVLVDVCTNGNCYGANRAPGVWSNGVITPLPFPPGYTYLPNPLFYHINDSGTVVGAAAVAGSVTSQSRVVIWTNGAPAVMPDAPLVGEGNLCSIGSDYQGGAGSSLPYGINAAGHIAGTTSYPSSTRGGPSCAANWVYNGSTFRVLAYGPYSGVGSLVWPYSQWPFPIPSACANLPLGYYPGVDSLLFGAVLNDADVVLQTEQNYFCSPVYGTPGVPWSSDPFLTQTNNSYSFLGLGSLTGAMGSSINNLGFVLGFTDPAHVIIWDNNGIHDLGPGGYSYMNNVGQVVYLGGQNMSQIMLWQKGVSTTIELPAGVSGVPAAINDAGQIVVSNGSAGSYLLTPGGTCAEDVTAQVQISRTGFRYNHSTGMYYLIGSVTNISGTPIPAPVSLVVDKLPAGVSLYNIAGATVCNGPAGSPFVELTNGDALPAGGISSGSIQFIDPDQTGITLTFRVLAGTGIR